MDDQDRTHEMPDEDRSCADPGAEAPTEPQDPATERRRAEAPTEPQDPATQPRSRRLLRSRSDRMILGVAGGLGRYFGVDPVIFRIGFGVSVFFGGLGVLVYLALAVFVPTGDGGQAEAQAPYQRSPWLGVAAGIALVLLLIPAIGFGFWWGGPGWGWGWDGPWGLLWLAIPLAIGLGAYAVLRDRRERGERFTFGRVLAAILLVAVALFAFCVLAIGAAFAEATGNGVVVAAAVVFIGLLLLASAFARGARWLIIPAAALATGVGVAAAADLDFPGGIGEERFRPVALSSLPANGYEHGVGRLVVDLRDLDWRPDQVLPLDVDLGLGQIEVAVPERVCVAADLHTGAGDLMVTGERNDGLDVDSHVNVGARGTPRLELDGEVDVGQIRVLNDDSADLDRGPGRGFSDTDRAAMRAAAEKACARPSASRNGG